jgi:hypothetical protein
MVRIADEFGPHLIGRDVGNEIRRRYFSAEPSTWPRHLDFKGVVQATESCIDELFAPLARTYGLAVVMVSVKIEGAARPVREAVDYIFAILKEPPAAFDVKAARDFLGAPKRRSAPRPKATTRKK